MMIDEKIVTVLEFRTKDENVYIDDDDDDDDEFD